MPEDVLSGLKAENLLEAYQARPAYQQNDYIGWITRAKQPATRQKRIKQLLSELKSGDKYMKMDYSAS